MYDGRRVLYLEDMLEAMGQAEEFVEGLSFEAYLQDARESGVAERTEPLPRDAPAASE